ncbi:10241_t:CDS:1, partial [Entrophospora sp. SA101]
LWQELIPYLKFQPPASDLCDKCEMFKAEMAVAKSDVENYEKTKKEYEGHRECANHERMHYNNNIEK